jgi:hypothetical protein
MRCTAAVKTRALGIDVHQTDRRIGRRSKVSTSRTRLRVKPKLPAPMKCDFCHGDFLLIVVRSAFLETKKFGSFCIVSSMPLVSRRAFVTERGTFDKITQSLV